GHTVIPENVQPVMPPLTGDGHADHRIRAEHFAALTDFFTRNPATGETSAAAPAVVAPLTAEQERVRIQEFDAEMHGKGLQRRDAPADPSETALRMLDATQAHVGPD